MFQRLFLAFLFILANVGFALGQNRTNYQLLWRIEGNGLTVPSYLYGTMHVKDPRAFAFSDSVYKAIERCEGFALEVHPDSMYKHMYSTMVDDKNQNYFREYAQDNSEYEEFAKRFTEETGLGLDQLNYTDPWTFDMFYSGAKKNYEDFPVFVDAWLYRNARDQGKLIFGVESMDDHSNLFESLDKDQQREVITSRFHREESQLDEMIDIYHTGNLDSLMRFMEVGMTPDYKYALLTKRNYVMARNMDSLSAIRPMFFAVGSGHLPGEEGVIAILREKGFKLTAVQADFTGYADDYKPKKVEQPWKEFKVSDAGVKAMFPNDPFKIDLFTQMNMYMYPDLGTGRNYMLMIIGNDLYKGENIDFDKPGEATEHLMNVMADRGNVLGKKLFERNGRKVGEVIMKQGGMEGIYRTNIIVENGMIYFFMVGVTKDDIRSDDANRYLKSVDFFEPMVAEEDWREVKNENGAFALTLPSKPTYNPEYDWLRYGRGEIHMHNYELFQHASKTHYFYQYYDQPAGYLAGDTMGTYGRVVEWMEEYGHDLDIEASNITIDGFPAKKYWTTTEDEKMLVGVTLQRGNRTYMVTAEAADSTNKADVDRYISSFRMLDFKSQELEAVSVFDSTVTISFTKDFFKRYEEPRYHPDDVGLDTMYKYAWLDPFNSTTLTINAFRYNKFQYIEDKDTLMQYLMDGMTEEEDSIVKQSPWNLAGTPNMLGLQADVVYDDRFTKGWYAVAFNGSEAYEFYLTYPPELEGSELLKRMKNDIKIKSVSSDINYEDSTLSRVLVGLMDTSVVVRKKAASLIHDYPIYSNEVALLIDAVKQNLDAYPPEEDDYYYESPVNKMLILVNQKADSTHVDGLDSLYHHEAIPHAGKTQILGTMAEIKSRKSLSRMLVLYQYLDKSERNNYAYGMVSPFIDSVELCRDFYPDLMGLLPDEHLDEPMMRASLNLLENSEKDSLLVADYKVLFQAQLKQQIDSCVQSDAEFRPWYKLYGSIRLVTRFGEDEKTAALLQKVIDESDSKYAKCVAVVGMMKMGRKVEEKELEEFRNWESNYFYYQELERAKLLHLLAEGELNQEKVARMMLVQQFERDYTNLKDAKMLLKKVVMVDSVEYNVYVFRIQDAEYDNDRWYTAISGLQPLDETKYNFECDFCRVSNEPYHIRTFNADADQLVEDELQWRKVLKGEADAEYNIGDQSMEDALEGLQDLLDGMEGLEDVEIEINNNKDDNE